MEASLLPKTLLLKCLIIIYYMVEGVYSPLFGPTRNSPLCPLNLSNILLPDLTIISVTSLLNLIKMIISTINQSKVEEILKLDIFLADPGEARAYSTNTSVIN